jgi:DNA-directed RNA polymerase subunit RPC12/RpoP
MQTNSQVRFYCDHCAYTVQVWDGDHPYLLDWRGKRWYYAPTQPAWQVILEIEYTERRFLSDWECQRLLRKQGSASEQVCLTCGRITWIDPTRDKIECWWCGGIVMQGTALEGKRCPKCQQGVLHRTASEEETNRG